jgi:hypothetical protein
LGVRIHQKKSIHCIGGIEWGFELSDFRLRPKTTDPRLLNKEHWEKAWQILQEKLPGYTIVKLTGVSHERTSSQAILFP